MSLRIRLARAEDANEILEVYKSGGEWLPYTDVEEIRKCIKDNEGGKVSIIVVESDGKIAGALKLHRPQSHIGKGGKVAVLPEYRNKNIGKTLYRSAIKIFDMEGRRKVTDSLVGDNPAITKMFNDIGFEIEAEMRKHTPGGKTLYQFAYHIDEKGIPDLGDVIFEIPETKYMELMNQRNNNEIY